MGDSAITETAGFGAFVIEGAPAFSRGLPADMSRLRAITAENAKLMAGSNPILLVATNDNKPLRAGLDLRKVREKGDTFVLWLLILFFLFSGCCSWRGALD